MTAARDSAFEKIYVDLKSWPNIKLHLNENNSLSFRDQKLSLAIHRQVRIRFFTLKNILIAFMDRSWEDTPIAIKVALLGGSAQMLLLDKLPDHAVINHAVDWPKKYLKNKRSTGAINAILRKIAQKEKIQIPNTFTGNDLLRSDGSKILIKNFCLTKNKILNAAVVGSLPTESILRWAKRYGEEQAIYLANHSIMEPPIIIANDSNDTNLTTPHVRDNFSVFNGTKEELVYYLKKNKNLRVQDPHTSESILLTTNMSPKIIIDYAAGKGTKTKQLSDLFPNAKILAHEIHPKRSKTLLNLCSSLNNVDFVPRNEIKKYIGKADLLLLDVPCSNSGVLPRRPEAKYRLTAPHINNIAKVQRQIIADTLPLLSPSGHLLYTTCSIEPEENEQIVQWIKKFHPFKLLKEQLLLPKGHPGDAPSHYADGGYGALLTRSIHTPS